MNTRKLFVSLALIVAIAVTLACSFSSILGGPPTVSNIRMTTDESGSTTTTTYSPNAAFFVFADLANLSAGQVIEAKWYAVSATGLDANLALNTSDYTFQSGISYIYFKLSTSDGSPWPTGTYKVELYLDNAKVGEALFTVQ